MVQPHRTLFILPVSIHSMSSPDANVCSVHSVVVHSGLDGLEWGGLNGWVVSGEGALFNNRLGSVMSENCRVIRLWPSMDESALSIHSIGIPMIHILKISKYEITMIRTAQEDMIVAPLKKEIMSFFKKMIYENTVSLQRQRSSRNVLDPALLVPELLDPALLDPAQSTGEK